MYNFSIGIQIQKEINEFRSSKIKMAALDQQGKDNVRYLNSDNFGYFFNQADAISTIDLYYNSKFENGSTDNQGQRKLFMNVGKFRSEVASKQIDLDTKDFKFKTDDYADPWTAIFLQKDFHEWTKDTDKVNFAELLNTCVDNFPKYGTVVLKKVGKQVFNVPLQNLINEQTAETLETATYVIEMHPDMHIWEIQDMPLWNTEGLVMDYGDCMDVYERYGYVPLAWLKKQNNQDFDPGEWMIFRKALIIAGFVNSGKDTKSKDGIHIFFAKEIKSLPYREVHWTKQHGRWLGCGVMEDLVENQKAKNIIVNLIRRSLNWSAKRVLQSTSTDVSAKNLVKDVQDGEILEIGANGEITQVDLQSRNNAEFQQFLNEWEHNSDQKAFTYEVATGESLPGGTPFRLGVVLSNAVNSYFKKKQEQLGIFLKKTITDFLIPQFLNDMKNTDRTLAMFSGDAGFEIVKQAVIDAVKSQAVRASLLTGKPVDTNLLEQIAFPFKQAESLFLPINKNAYDELSFKFDLDVTGEDIDIQEKVETLKNLYEVLAQAQDSRAEKVLERIASLAGENMSQFGKPVSNPIQSQNLPQPPAKLNSPQNAQISATTYA